MFSLVSLIAASNFSTILLMRREGIARVKIGTGVICVLVVPVLTWIMLGLILNL